MQELLHSGASIQQCFDKALDFDSCGDLGLTPGAMSRLITSRSLEKLIFNMRVMLKRKVKIATVKMAVSALLAVEPADKEEGKERQSAKLAEFHNSPFWE